MAKTKISEFDSTPANNTDINGINIAEGCAPSGINNALRQMMANLKDMNIGSTITMLNDTEEDGEGGRANKIIFKGEQSGGEESVLGEIQASHDGTSDDQKGDLIFKTNDGSDGTSPTEAVRIDSSQNLLVGATAVGVGTSASDTGIVARGSIGFLEVARDGSNPVRLNRQSSDGSIIDFAKDGTQVGSIGVESNDNFYIADAATNTGLNFKGFINPCDSSGSSSRDLIDLGHSTQGRFKDLYLSGNVYLGGTGSANALNDYEYGTFTPTYGGGTTDPSGVTYDSTVGNEGVYVKIGKLVFIQINIRTDAISNKGSGDLRIEGLPFAAASLSGQGGVGSLAVSQAKDFAGEVPSAAYITEGATSVTLFYRTSADGNALSSSVSDLGTGANDNLIRIGGTYYSTA